MKIRHFKNAVVRDLAWVMHSPGLMVSSLKNAYLVSDEYCQKNYVAQVKQLKLLDENPSPLLDHLLPLKNHRLGFYFEALLAYWVEHMLPSTLFNKNIPVFQQLEKTGRRTIGEFDFVFTMHEERELRHWEATVKFYLLYKNSEGKVRWVGPGGRDRLDSKLTRLFEHQLRLANTVEGEATLNNLSRFDSSQIQARKCNLEIQSSAFIKGYLFYPLREEKDLEVEMEDYSLYRGLTLSPEHLKGWWVRYGEKMLLNPNVA